MSKANEYQRAYYAKNRERLRARFNAWRQRNIERERERARINMRKQRSQYRAAGGDKPEKCELCNTVAFLVFDHNHETGKFRGWLCATCNTMLGMARDNPEVLRKAAEYVSSG